MHNFKRGHRATSIGTQLLTNYRKYLAAYEKAWADVDLATYAGRPLIQVHIVMPSLPLLPWGQAITGLSDYQLAFPFLRSTVVPLEFSKKEH